jgi:hypothetical protein
MYENDMYLIQSALLNKHPRKPILTRLMLRIKSLLRRIV